MIKYNLDKLINVKLRDSELADGYYWVSEDKKFLWFKTLSMGLYFLGQYQGVIIPNYLKIDIGGIYIKPRVILNFQDEITKVKYYESFREAEEFFEELTKDKKFLQL